MTDQQRTCSRRQRARERDWVRSRPVRIMFRPGELADLRAIAKGWGVPVATAVWAILHDQLARFRRQQPNLGPTGLAIAAALAVTRQNGLRVPEGGGRYPEAESRTPCPTGREPDAES